MAKGGGHASEEEVKRRESVLDRYRGLVLVVLLSPEVRESSRGPSMTHGTAKIKHWVVGPQWAEVPPTSVSRWSLYSSVQTCGVGRFRPLPRVFPSHPIPSA